MAKYTLVGVDGNAFAIMGYTARALRKEGLGKLVDGMMKEATSGNYYELIETCDKYVTIANTAAGYDPNECDNEDDEEEEEDDEDDCY